MIRVYFIASFLCSISLSYGNFNFFKDLSMRPLDKEGFRNHLNEKLFRSTDWLESINFEGKEYKLEYTFNEKLTSYVKRVLRRYRSDYASVVVIDNNTGEILTAVDYTRKTKKFGKSLTFSSTNPAASIFKVVTAADLIENTEVETDSKFSYAGKSTTLYKYQLKADNNRWSRTIPFRKAFALSNNVVFGKAAIKKTTYPSLAKMANRFRFNKDNMQLVELGNSTISEKGGDYELAELASGFNRKTMISPVHGAIIASIIASDGIFRKPTLFSTVTDTTQDRVVWNAPLEIERSLSEESAKAMQELMETTVRRGTARSAFRRPRSRLINKLKIGGKTGTITGGVPHGRRDWFISYAMPQNSDDRGVSVCVMIVKLEKWYIKSSVFARKVIEYYFRNIVDDKV